MKITLTQLCHHRWILPILSELHQQNGGSKFVTLLNRLKLSRDSLSRTLQIMLELQLIARNTVYAHPLRPEYILIDQKLGEHAHNLIQQLEPNQETLLNKWALPTILALQTHHRFSKLLEVLPSITSRALTMTLKDLGQCGYIRHQQRQYVLTPTGELIANSVALLGGSRVIRNPI